MGEADDKGQRHCLPASWPGRLPSITRRNCRGGERNS